MKEESRVLLSLAMVDHLFSPVTYGSMIPYKFEDFGREMKNTSKQSDRGKKEHE